MTTYFLKSPGRDGLCHDCNPADPCGAGVDCNHCDPALSPTYLVDWYGAFFPSPGNYTVSWVSGCLWAMSYGSGYLLLRYPWSYTWVLYYSANITDPPPGGIPRNSLTGPAAPCDPKGSYYDSESHLGAIVSLPLGAAPMGHTAPGPYQLLNIAINALPSTPENMPLKTMVGQLQELMKQKRSGSCQDRAYYRRRLEAKVALFCVEFGPASLHSLAKQILAAWNNGSIATTPCRKNGEMRP